MKTIDITEEKQIALEILIYFANFCEKNELKYYLAYGTLLGAVRHKGYIPWDDDIDVMMPRKDYMRLLKIFPNHPYYKMMDISIEPKYGKLFGSLNDIRTIKEEKLTRKRCLGTVGVNIDIFPIDNLPDKEEEQDNLLSNVKTLENKLACFTYGLGKGRTFLSTIKKNLGILYYRTLELFGIYNLEKLYNDHKKLMSKYNSSTNTVGSLTNTRFNGTKEFLPRRLFEEIVLLDFENRKFSVPKEYDEVLTRIYGDYMKLPPLEKRITHHENNCYWKD